MTLKEIKSYLDQFPEQVLLEEMQQFVGDERESVRNLLLTYTKKVQRYANEMQRVTKMWDFDVQATQKTMICGVDEVGRGPFAGPVVAGAVIMKPSLIPYINDSKKLSKEKRDLLIDQIIDNAYSYGIGIVDVKTINDIGIKNATLMAMEKAIQALNIMPEFVLVDAETIPNIHVPQKGIIKGDALSYSIAAASILAKVTRDRMMDAYDVLYPEYGFLNHKGYGTDEHRLALKMHGATPIHRTQFIRNHI